MISSRAMATLGLGFSARAVAVLGWLDLAATPPAFSGPPDATGVGGSGRQGRNRRSSPRRPDEEDAFFLAVLA